jgi:hypothetical protein
VLCQECPKKPTCTELCPRAEKYVSQGYGSTKEYIPKIPISEYRLQDPDAMEWPVCKKNKKQLILEMYFKDNLRQSEIAKKLYISRQYVNQVIHNKLCE